MKLTVFNGSPRRENSNTRLLLDNFLEGFTATQGNSYELLYLMDKEKNSEFVRTFRNADTVLLAFPLYFDAMPAIVKSFIETLQPFCGRIDNPNIGFIVQSGFPDAIHLQYIEHYLEKLAARLGGEYKGTVIKGGVEIVRLSTVLDNKAFECISKLVGYVDLAKIGHMLDKEKLSRVFYNLGKNFGITEQFDMEITKSLSEPKKLSKLGPWLAKFVALIYMNILLKKNKVLDKVSSKPYV